MTDRYVITRPGKYQGQLCFKTGNQGEKYIEVELIGVAMYDAPIRMWVTEDEYAPEGTEIELAPYQRR